MGRLVHNVTRAPIGSSLFHNRDRVGAYAFREAAFKATTAAGFGMVTASKLAWQDQSSRKSKSRYRGLTVGSLTCDSYEPATRIYYKMGELSRVRLPTCCLILLDFGAALTQSLRLVAYIAAMHRRNSERLTSAASRPWMWTAPSEAPSILSWLPMDLTGPVRSSGANESGSA